MKQIITLYVVLSMTANVFSQAPDKMSYQAVIRDESNTLVNCTPVGIQISILHGSENGTAIYVETHLPISNSNGLVSLEIGTGSIISGDFTTIEWANGPYFIKTETDPTGGTNYTITVTSQLLSLPFALYSQNAGTFIEGSSFTHYIGEVYGGGVIFHLWKDNTGVEHGLILSLTNQSNGQEWSNVLVLSVGTSAQSTWNGLSNSNAIIGQDGHNSSAAKLCLDLVSGGQSDWYLPSIQELKMLWNNYYTVERILSQISGAGELTNSSVSECFWSSSEYNQNDAWAFNFHTGHATYIAKGYTLRVRAIRAF